MYPVSKISPSATLLDSSTNAIQLFRICTFYIWAFALSLSTIMASTILSSTLIRELLFIDQFSFGSLQHYHSKNHTKDVNLHFLSIALKILFLSHVFNKMIYYSLYIFVLKLTCEYIFKMLIITLIIKCETFVLYIYGI